MILKREQLFIQFLKIKRILEGQNVYEFAVDWKLEKGFEEFLKLPFKIRFRELLKQKFKFTDEIYNRVEKETLEAERNNEKWDHIVKNQAKIKCKLDLIKQNESIEFILYLLIDTISSNLIDTKKRL
jgi:hypothetical protein